MNHTLAKARLAAVTFALVLGGCASERAQPAQPAPARFADPASLLKGSSVNAEMFEKPEELFRVSDVVVAGTVAGIKDGFEVLNPAVGEEAYAIRHYSAVIEVRVETEYKDVLGAADTKSVFVSIPRGAQQEPGDDDGGAPTVATLAEVERAVPLGSKVVVMAFPVRHPDEWLKVVDADRGTPKGAVLLSGGHPQSLAFSTEDGATTAWPNLSMAALEVSLDENLE